MGHLGIAERIERDDFDAIERNYAIRMLCAILQNEMAACPTAQTASKSATRCPRCNSRQFVRHGKDEKGRQRYRCKTCRSSFTASTGKPLSSSRLSPTTWTQFIECHVDLLSLRETAAKCSVSLKTAFRMRHRLLAIIERHFHEEYFSTLHAKPTPRTTPSASFIHPGFLAHANAFGPSATSLPCEIGISAVDKQNTSISVYLATTRTGRESIIIDHIICGNAHLATCALARKSLKRAASLSGALQPIVIRRSLNCSTFVARFKHTTTHTLPRYRAWHRWIRLAKLTAFAHELATRTITKARMLAPHGPVMLDLSIVPLAKLFAEYAPQEINSPMLRQSDASARCSSSMDRMHGRALPREA